MAELCEACDGTGYGPCDACGDEWADCACDEPEESECASCGGTGEVGTDDLEDDEEWEDEDEV